MMVSALKNKIAELISRITIWLGKPWSHKVRSIRYRIDNMAEFISRTRIWLGQPLINKIESISHGIDKAHFRIYAIRGFDFGGNIPSNELVAESKFSIANAKPYQPSSISVIRKLLDEIKFSGYECKNFLDVGCGKGFVCIYVSQKFNFQKIVGFDFSKPLIEIATGNLLKASCKNVTFAVGDATNYLIPGGDTVVFLFNPFNETILTGFIQNNISHFLENRSIVAYSNDVHRKVLIDLGFEIIFRSQQYKSSIWKYTKQTMENQ